MIHNLSGRQLNAVAEVVFANQERIGRSDEIPKEDMKEEADRPLKQQTEGAPQQKRKWTQQDEPFGFSFQNTTFLIKEIFHQLKCMKFLYDEIFHICLIVSDIWDYALFENSPDPEVSKEELKLFLGVLIASGHNELPCRRFTGTLEWIRGMGWCIMQL
jgi:hypothetical protein